MSALSIKDLTVRFGGITAISDLNLQVERGQIFSVIGPNGAGKTTMFNAITGITPPKAGQVLFAGETRERPLTWRVIASAIVVGLLVSLWASLAVIGVEQLWVAAIRKPFAAPDARFDAVVAFHTVKDFVRDVPVGRVVGASLSGFVLGAIGTFAVWHRGRRTPDVIAAHGVARTFQNIRLFRDMTVLENVLVGMDRQLGGSLLAMALQLPGQHAREIAAERRGSELLRFVGLTGHSGQLARNLPYGDQRRLEIARALATSPTLLLLDEPAAGMNPSETVGLMDLIRRIRDRGVTVLLIEHHMNIVMGISDRVAVLDYGVKIAEGTPSEVSRDPRVIEAYLGKEEVN